MEVLDCLLSNGYTIKKTSIEEIENLTIVKTLKESWAGFPDIKLLYDFKLVKTYWEYDGLVDGEVEKNSVFYFLKIKREKKWMGIHEKKILFIRNSTEVPFSISPPDEFVYFLKSTHGGIKIGKTKSVKQRMENMFVKLPFPNELIRVIPTKDSTKLEKQLHEHFKDKKINGEWFDITEKDVHDIFSITPLNFVLPTTK